MEKFKLIEVCDFQGGSQPPKDQWIDKFEDGYIRMLQIRDFTQGKNEKEYVKLSNNLKTCEEDDILIARYGASVGKILTGLSGAYNVAIIKSIPDTKKLIKRYVYYYFNSDYFQNRINNVGSRAAQAGFNKNDLEEFDIYVPSLKKQEQIVNILDKSQELINKRKEQIKALDELVKSKFIEMFGDLKINFKQWNILAFDEFATIDTNMTKEFEKYADYPHIGIDSIEKNTGNILDYQLVRECSLKSGKYLFDERHIIYSKIRPNLNKVALPTFKGVCSADAYPILCIDKITDRNYLGYVLRSEFFLNYILAFSGRTNIPKVNKEQLKGFSMPTPPIELQNQFSNFIKQVDKLKFELENSLKELENNFNSLMQKAFKGELFK